jgi:hypothetical protein
MNNKITDFIMEVNTDLDYTILDQVHNGYTEEIEIKKGKFIQIKDCKIATNYLLNNFTHWLERYENRNNN